MPRGTISWLGVDDGPLLLGRGGPKDIDAIRSPELKQPALGPPAQAVIRATVMVGVLVAWASEIPMTVRDPALLLGLLAWTAAVAFGSVQAGRTAWYRPLEWSERAATVLGVAGIGIAALSAAQLEVVRILYGRPGMVWNVDWRFAWNHAQAIARFGDANHALDYSGAPLDYHIGPAWLGGMSDRVLGGGMTEVLFGLVPVLCIVSAATAFLLLLGRNGVPWPLAAAAVGVAFCLPVYLNRLPRGFRDYLLDADRWFFASGLMLNSSLGVAVGLCSLVLLLDRQQRAAGIVLGAVGLGSLVQIKPQFFVGLGAVAGIVGLGRLLGFKPFHPRTWRVLVAGAGALALAILAKSVLPGHHASFTAPVWAPGSTGYSAATAYTESLIAPSLLVILAVSAWLSRSSAAVMHLSGRLGELLAAVVLALALLSTVLTLFSLPVPAAHVTRAEAVGYANVTITTQRNLAQALIPLRLLLAVTVLAAFAVVLRHTGTSRPVIAVVLVAGLIVISPLPLIGRNFVKPMHAYESAEDTGLLALLRQVPRNGELLLASDLADPAENYGRPLRGFLLTAYGGHQFYVANLPYGHYVRADAVQRLEDIRAFFGSPWSGWHAAWLARTQITHVLVSDRCVPRWLGQPEAELIVIGRSGRWTLLEPQGVLAEGSFSPPPWGIMKPRYGRSPCL
jgi:hypothetical protein